MQIGSDAAEQGEQQIGGRRGHAADEQDRHDAEAHDQQAAGAGAEQGHDQPEQLADAGDLLLGKAQVDVEHVGHHAHHRVRHPVGGDQAEHQQGLPAIARDEVADRREHRRQAAPAHGGQAGGDQQTVEQGAQEGAIIGEQAERVAGQQGEFGVVQLGEQRGDRNQQHDQHQHRGQLAKQAVLGGRVLLVVRLRLADRQAGDQSGQHQRGEQQVSAAPGAEMVGLAGGAEPAGEVQRAGGGQQGGHPVAGHVTGGQGGLPAVLGDFQAIGIDGDVLGRGGEGYDYRQADQPGQMLARIEQRHADQAKNHQTLGQHQPGATPAKATEQRQAPLVEHRRPHPLEGIGQADQAGEANGLQRYAGLAQPHRQRGEHQHVGQAGGETEQQQGQSGRAGIGGEGVTPRVFGHGKGEAGGKKAASNRSFPPDASRADASPHGSHP